MACVVTGKAHVLRDIHKTPEGACGVSQAIRWCCHCGAIVIDIDVDGTVHPGRIMPMQFPKIALDMGKK